MSPSDPLLQALAAHYATMPPVVAMAMRIDGYEDDRLRVSAPLALHVNDKGSAFGGSLASLLTLASWGLVSLQLRRAGIEADVYVADSEIRYLAPLYDDLVAESRLAEGESWDTFVRTLRARGRARTSLEAEVPLPDAGGVATSFRARYVAIAKQ